VCVHVCVCVRVCVRVCVCVCVRVHVCLHMWVGGCHAGVEKGVCVCIQGVCVQVHVCVNSVSVYSVYVDKHCVCSVCVCVCTRVCVCVRVHAQAIRSLCLWWLIHVHVSSWCTPYLTLKVRHVRRVSFSECSYLHLQKLPERMQLVNKLNIPLFVVKHAGVLFMKTTSSTAKSQCFVICTDKTISFPGSEANNETSFINGTVFGYGTAAIHMYVADVIVIES